jgi:hypothetical protein
VLKVNATDFAICLIFPFVIGNRRIPEIGFVRCSQTFVSTGKILKREPSQTPASDQPVGTPPWLKVPK